MNISFKKDINKSYMVIEKVREYSDVDFPVRILERNDIPGLLKMSCETINGRYDLLYEISSKQAFSKLFETKKISFEQVRNLLFSLKGVLRALEEYLLDADNIILKQECIFLDPEAEQIEYCYYPYYNGDLMLELRELFQKMLSIVDYEDEKAVRLVYEIHGELQKDNFTMDNLLDACQRVGSPESLKIRKVMPEEIKWSPEEEKKIRGLPEIAAVTKVQWPEAVDSYSAEQELEDLPILEKIRSYLKGKRFFEILDDINSGEFVEKIRNSTAPGEKTPILDPAKALSPKNRAAGADAIPSKKRSFISDALPEPKNLSERRPEIEYVNLAEHGNNRFAEESRYLEGGGEGTVLLSQGGKENHKLVGMKGQEGVRFIIRTFPFTIGKLESSSDAVLPESTISRMHARIYEQEEGFFLEDLNSTNGTFLNESRLPAYRKMPLKEGDHLRFAEEEFCFR